MVVYRITLPEAKSRVSFEDPLSMIRYVDAVSYTHLTLPTKRIV